MATLIVATGNPGKLREMRALLESWPLEVRGAPDLPPVEETGSTYAANAELKARSAAAWSGEWAIADDSGIEVDALGGEPGIHSARFAGPGASAEERNQALLERLRGVPPDLRSARFRAAVAIAAPDGRLWMEEGVVEGLILTESSGVGGFGYDPLFWIPDEQATMAQLNPARKNVISHRGRAVRALSPVLDLLATRRGA